MNKLIKAAAGTVFVMLVFVMLVGHGLANGGEERVHTQTGFAIVVPDGWQERSSSLGFRLARNDAVIHVALQVRRDANLETFFKSLESPLPGTLSSNVAPLRRHAARTVELLSKPALCAEYVTGTKDNDRRSFVTFAVHQGKGFVLSLDCSADDQAELYDAFKEVVRSFRITPVIQQAHPGARGDSQSAPTTSTSFTEPRGVKSVVAPAEELSDDDVQLMLEASGVSEVKRDPPDGKETLFKMRVAGRTFGIINDRAHGQLRCYAFFGAGGEGVTERRLRTVNAWNSDNRFAKAFVYDNGSWVLESDLRYGQGPRPEAIMSHVARFAAAVPRFVKHVEELMAAN